MIKIKIGHIILAIFTISLLGLSLSCSKDKTKQKDLSFGGITIGEVFPDSLKNSFKFYPELDVPTYEGGIKFDFPNEPKADISIITAIDPSDDEVISIDIFMEESVKAYDFYNMLKSKYGLPISDYGDTDCSLQYFIHRLYTDLGYERYSKQPDISGRRVLAEWTNTGHASNIMMISDTYHFPDEYNPKLSTYITFRYVNKSRLNRVQEEAEQKSKERKRNNYRQNNRGAMNQDF